jgi:phosphate transport system protein
MGSLVENAISGSIEALKNSSREEAEGIIAHDEAIDQLEVKIVNTCVSLFALRQPMGRDLRVVISALKISSNLERIADYGTNMAKRTLTLSQQASGSLPLGPLSRMVHMVCDMVQEVLKAFYKGDLDLATKIWHQDRQIDDMYNSYLRELLTHMMEKPQSLGALIELLFVAKHLERAGDHVSNMAESVHYLVTGTLFDPEGSEG